MEVLKMKINKKLAKGIHIVGDDFEKVIAIRKPDADTKIKFQIWVKCKVKKLKK